MDCGFHTGNRQCICFERGGIRTVQKVSDSFLIPTIQSERCKDSRSICSHFIVKELENWDDR